jgi:hypothetical protein
VSKASGGGAANNIGPNYEDGGMLANDNEWVTYGGLLAMTDSYPPPGESSFATDRLYPSNQEEIFEPGYVLGQLPADTTRYVTYGAAVDIKSENLAFYFSGLRSASHGPIYLSPGPANESLNADQLSPTLIELDMDPLHLESWKNHTLPDEAPGRASAEIVWVPVSEKGILIAIGGVVYPAYANIYQKNNASLDASSVRSTYSALEPYSDTVLARDKPYFHVDRVCVRCGEWRVVQAKYDRRARSPSTRLCCCSVGPGRVKSQYILVRGV